MSQSEIFSILEKYKEILKREIKERAERDAVALQSEVNDELEEGNWYNAVKAAITDLTTFPACFIKGPIIRNQPVLSWEYDDILQRQVPVVVNKLIRQYERVSPFDIYPSPMAKNVQDGYLVEILHLSNYQLEQMIGVEGFSEENIRKVLDEFSSSGHKELIDVEFERLYTENRSPIYQDNKGIIDCLEYWGTAKGKDLIDWGMSPEVITEPLFDYHVSILVVAKTVISARLNPDPTNKRPYYSTSYIKIPDSIWGNSLLELMKDIIRICNNIARSMVKNLSLASGPQVWVNRDRIPDYNDTKTIYPNKVWIFEDSDLIKGVPIGFFQPPLNARELIYCYDYWFKMASEVTNVPSYWYGAESASSAGGGTASGLDMMMKAATKGLKRVARNFDDDIIKPSVYSHWLHIMLNEPEKAIGDINIIPRASEYLLMLDQLQNKRLEFLQITGNPIDMGIIGVNGRAEVLRETARSLKLDTHRIVPDRWDMQVNEQGKSAEDINGILNSISQGTGIPIDKLQMLAQSGGRDNSGQGQIPQPPSMGNANRPSNIPIPQQSQQMLPNGASQGVQFSG